MKKERDEKLLKSWLKEKITITTGTVVAFLITGSIGATVAYGALNEAGTGSDTSVSYGQSANAGQARSIALGKGATISNGQDTIAIGTDTKVQGHTSIVIGKNAKTTSAAEGTVVIGRDAFSEGSGNGGRPNTVVGREAYTGFGEKGTYRLNAATALGFGAGAGLRTDPGNGNKLINNKTNADNNAEVLVKAGYGVDENTPADTKAALQRGTVNDGLTFYRKKHINESTAIGAEARAIGDQSIAIGGQVVAGDDVIALGGNDTDQLRNNKYQVVTDDAVNRTNVNTIDDYNLAYTESTRTVAEQYKELVGRGMPTAYKSTYGQSGSVVIGMEAHSTTALGTAIGTNSVVRMGAFGATAIGAGSTVQPNADAAVAIGMGSVANGAYSLAAGTASWAEFGDVAIGYQAKASGKDGAIAMGRATNAQGDSSIMIGGANIKSASQQATSFEKATKQITKKEVTEIINGKPVKREYSFAGTTPTNGTVAQAYKELTGLDMNVDSVDFTKNKNGHASTSLGVHALSKADLGTAIGASSRADAIGSVALGAGAHATRQNAVAIGTGSTTELVGTRQLSVSYDKDGNIVDDNSKEKAYTFNWAGGINTSEGDVVSFGSSGAERQLKNVAAGRVAEDSTDAINGSQLNSIAQKVASGWNIGDKNKAKVAGIGTEDQVNFINGNGTTVTVEKQEEIKNGTTITTPKGANVKFDVKAKDGSITSDANGISVNTDGTTITKDADGKLKVNTGNITNNNGVPAVADADKNKIATVDTVTNAIKDSYWIASAEKDGTKKGTDDNIKAGTKVIFDAGKNIEIEHSTANKFTFKTVDTPEFKDITLNDGSATPNKVKLAPTTDGLKLSKGDNDNSPVKITNVKDGDVSKDSKDAINGSQFHKVAKNTIKLAGQNGTDTATETTGQDLDKTGGIKFTVKSSDGKLLDVVAAGDTITLTPKTATLTTTDGVPTANTDGGKLVTADDLITTLKGMGWKATAGKDGTGTVTGNAEELIKAGDTVTFKAGDNLKIKQSAKEFIYSLNPELTGLKSAEFKDAEGNTSKLDGTGLTITPKDTTKKPVSVTKDGINAGGNTISNVKSGLEPIKAADNKAAGLVNLNTPNVSDNNAVTVGDIKNLGWVVSSDKTTGNLTAPFSAQVKNANEVEFIGKNNAVVSATTDGNGKHTVTVDVTVPDVEKGTIELDGDNKGKVKSKTGDGDKFTTVDTVVNAINSAAWKATSGKEGSGAAATGHTESVEEIKAGDTVTFKAGDNLKIKQSGKEFTYSLNPELTNLSKVEVKDDKGNSVVTTPTGTTVTDKDGNTSKLDGTGLTITPKDTTKEPVSVTKDGINAGGNAISNVAGNLDGAKKDTTSPKTSSTGPSTTDLPNIVNNAATVGDVLNAGWNLQNNGTAKDFVKPYDTVNFVDGGNTVAEVTTDADGKVSNVTYNVSGLPITYTKADGTPVSKVKDKYYEVDPATGKPDMTKEVQPGDLKTTLVNPNPANGKTGTKDPSTLNNVTSGLDKITTGPAKDLVDLSKPTDGSDPKVSDNTAATVGDLRNMGWVVSSDKTTDGAGEYSEQVKNANEVRFIGKGTATVSGKTVDGVRTITVDVDAQKSTNNSVTPVVYTKADGTKVYPIKQADGTTKFFENPDGTGAEVPKTDVITSVNGPEGTTSPTTLSNVKGNLPQVNDKDKTVFDPKTGTTKPADDKNTTKAPITAAEAADIVKNAGNNAATVGDVLNAGWNLQNNGTAKDFVKPYDTVNFINGGNTTAVVTTNAEGTTSNVTYNVTGLPITYTNEEGKPVSKVGDNYYVVNEKGQPLQNDGTPVTKYDANGNPLNDDGTPVTKVDTAAKPLSTNLVNPNAATDKQTTEPTTLKNVKGNLPQVNDKDKTVFDPKTGTTKPADDKNTTKAPITAAEAADIVKNAGNNAATVGDVLNAGWNLQNNGTAKDFVKPYDTVNFINGGNTTAVVTTNAEGTTSNVTYNVTGLPITYTNEEGKPVSKVGDNYYVVNEKGQPLQNDGTPVTKYDANGNPLNDDGTPVTKVDTAAKPLSTNLVNPNVAPDKQTTTPTQLGNVENGAKTFEPAKDADKKDLKLGNDGKWYPADKVGKNGEPEKGATPVTPVNPGKAGLVDFSKSNPTNAATVGDLQNMGWVVSSDKTTGDLEKAYNDQVRNANEVKFVGKNGIQVSGKTDDKGVRTLTFEMEAGEVTPTEITKADGTKLVKVGDKVYNPEDIGTDGKPKQGKDPVGTIAKDGKVYNNGDVTNGQPKEGVNPIDGITVTPNNGSKFVTGNQVADAIEKSGFVVGKNNKALSAADFKNEDEKVNPNDELRFADGDNTNVKLATKEVLDASGKVKTVTTVKVDVVDLPVKYTDADGNIVKKGEDGKYYDPKDLDGKVYDPATKTYKNADGTTLDKQPKAKDNDKIVSSLVNPNDAKDGKVGTPSTLTNVANGAKTFDLAKDADGKDLKLGNDGKWYPADKVGKNGEPEKGATPVTPVNPGKAGLVDFSKSNPTNVATVGDLQNMGWVVSTSDTGYNDQVRNTNKVDFKQGTGIKIKGETTADGTRQITIGLDTGKVTNEVTITKPNGEKVNAIKVTQPDGTVKYYEKDKDGKADLKKEVPVGTGDNDNKVTADDGSRVVTGNSVATAIQESGWNVGKADAKDVTKAFETEAKLHDKVNPNDDVKFVDGDNTTVSMVTIDSQNDDGTKKATTYIKTDINRDINIDSVTAGGKNADGTPGKDGALTVKDKNGNDRVKVAPNGMTITPNKADGTPDPDKAVSLTDKGLNNGGNNITNVKSNLPQVKDGDKKAYDVDGNPIANKNNTAAPITAADAADLLNPTKDGKPNPNFAGNNAATLSDVLNAGWNLQNNGTEKDFVKPYDTVNFVDGTNTTAVVTTSDDGTTSKVTYNVSGLPMSYTDKTGKPVSKIGDKYYPVNEKGEAISEKGLPAVGTNKDGKLVDRDGNVIEPINTKENPLSTNLVNPNVATDKQTTTPTQLGNVAPAEISPTSTQAVNGSQLYQVVQEINHVNNKVDKLGDRVNKGLAGAAAMSGIEFMEIGINQATVAAAVGGYRGTHAVAVGIEAAPTENTRVNAKASLTPGARTESMYSVGASYRFNWK